MKQVEYTKRKAREMGWEKGKPRLYATIWDKRGRLLAEGSNYKDGRMKTHPVQAKMAKKHGDNPHKQFLHAELDAIVSLLRRGKEAEAYLIHVVRLNKDGEEMNAKPCPICQAMIEEVGIKNVLFSC